MNSTCGKECLRTLIINLKVISKIGTGYKLNTKSVFLQLDDSLWYQCALRWYRGDNRYGAIEKVNATVRNISMVIKSAIAHPELTYLDLDAMTFLRDLLGTLQGALRGLENLKQTYNHDTTIVSQLELNITSVHERIHQIRKFVGLPPPDEDPEEIGGE